MFSLLSGCAALMVAASSAVAAIPSDGWYQLKNRATGTCIDTYGSTTNGAPLRNYSKGSAHNPQKFYLSSGSGFKRFNAYFEKAPRVPITTMYMDSLGVTGNGSVCGLWTSADSANQKWNIIEVGGGWYKIQNQANGLCLDNYGSTTNGDNIRFYASGSSYNQQWWFEPLGVGNGGGVKFWSERQYKGTESQPIGVGTYTTAQLAAKNVLNGRVNSQDWTGWNQDGSYSILEYPADNFGGTMRLLTQRFQFNWSNVYSLKIQAGVPTGWVYATASGGLTEFFPGSVFGFWIMMHNGDWCTLKSSGTARYTEAHETEYWMGSGNMVGPIHQVISGTNVLIGNDGTFNDLGTCTGTPLHGKDYYELNGEVKVINNENGCANNTTLRPNQY